VSELPYERGGILPDTAADVRKLRAAWQIVAARSGDVFNFTGLERGFDVGASRFDDELSAALHAERLTELGLEHLGGVPGHDDVFVANRMTAAAVAAMQVLVQPGDRVIGRSPTYTHPAVVRAVRLAGGEFVEGGTVEGAALAVVTRLAVSYDAFENAELERVLRELGERDVPVFVDDAGGARVGPAVFGQPKTLELGAVVGATGLDKYGTVGPRLGLLAGRADLVARIRARGIELGLEARPMLYPLVVASLDQYRPERVRELVATTQEVGDAVERRVPWLVRTRVALRLPGEEILAEAERRAGTAPAETLVPYEATAALAMLLLREHGILTVHFAALPPGTSALLLKFVPPETLAQFGGAEALAAAIDGSLTTLGGALRDGGVGDLLAFDTTVTV